MSGVHQYTLGAVSLLGESHKAVTVSLSLDCHWTVAGFSRLAFSTKFPGWLVVRVPGAPPDVPAVAQPVAQSAG